jgi:hypothetical protein
MSKCLAIGRFRRLVKKNFPETAGIRAVTGERGEGHINDRRHFLEPSLGGVPSPCVRTCDREALFYPLFTLLARTRSDHSSNPAKS